MPKNAFGAWCVVICLLATSGCLSLGGTTTIHEEDPQTKARLESLETRILALEQRLGPGPAVQQ